MAVVDKALIDRIVANVLAQLQPAAARTVASVPAVPASPKVLPTAVAAPSVPAKIQPEAKTATVELSVPVITADVLESSLRPGQNLRIGRTSIVTPSARDWLNSKRVSWTRQDRNAAANGTANVARARWHVILQSMTPTVRALQDGLKRTPEGLKVEVVGQPLEAAVLAASLVSTPDCDGVVIFTEQAELVACKANRNEQARAAVIQNARQWDLVVKSLSANVVCISPLGKTFMELRNLLRDCAGTKPAAPAGL